MVVQILRRERHILTPQLRPLPFFDFNPFLERISGKSKMSSIDYHRAEMHERQQLRTHDSTLWPSALVDRHQVGARGVEARLLLAQRDPPAGRQAARLEAVSDEVSVPPMSSGRPPTPRQETTGRAGPSSAAASAMAAAAIREGRRRTQSAEAAASLAIAAASVQSCGGARSAWR